MSTVMEGNARAHRIAPHPTDKLKWLLRREFWEHRGGFLWAPLIAGLLFLLVSLMGGGIGQMAFNKFRADPTNVTTINGVQVRTSELDLNQVLAGASASDLEQYGLAVNAATLMSGLWPLMVFGVVVFFYLLGSLYDERKDRSVLFWKSLPVSDGLTVWSKVVFALVVGPLIAIALALALMLLSGVVASVFLMINGGNPVHLYWSHLDPLRLVGATLAWLPLYILWALPTVGWLMLCSAWAKSKPFLWALLLPLGAGMLLGWFQLLTKQPVSQWFWQDVVPRLLLGTWPGSHVFGAKIGGYGVSIESADELKSLLDTLSSWNLLASPSLWVGAVAGIAMIFMAIRLRRWRDEG